MVEFPNEKENGNTPVAVVSAIWIQSKNNKTVCMWPNNVNNNKAFAKLVINKQVLSEDHNYLLCDVNIKYKTSK